MNKKKHPISKTGEELLYRVDSILSLAHENLLSAFKDEAVLEAGNNLLEPLGLLNKNFYGSNAFATIQRSLAWNLSFSLARLFEEPKKSNHPDWSDVASIPVLIHEIRKSEFRTVAMEYAARWTPDLRDMQGINAERCLNFLDGAILEYEQFKDSVEGSQALDALKHFRNMRMAHSLHHREVEVIPKYAQLFLLTDCARKVLQKAIFAIEGKERDFEVSENEYYKEAEGFWLPALNGVKSFYK